jgi:hypothetical protein
METNKPSRQKIWYQKNKALDNERSKQYKIDNKDEYEYLLPFPFLGIIGK